jgi:hypothetical protein
MWYHSKNGDPNINPNISLANQPDANLREVALLAGIYDPNIPLNELRIQILATSMQEKGLQPTGDVDQDLETLEEFYRIETAEFLNLELESNWQTIVDKFNSTVVQNLNKLRPEEKDKCIHEMNQATESAISLQQNKFLAQLEVLAKYIEL